MCGKDQGWCPVCTPLEEWTEEQEELVKELNRIECEIEELTSNWRNREGYPER